MLDQPSAADEVPDDQAADRRQRRPARSPAGPPPPRPAASAPPGPGPGSDSASSAAVRGDGRRRRGCLGDHRGHSSNSGPPGESSGSRAARRSSARPPSRRCTSTSCCRRRRITSTPARLIPRSALVAHDRPEPADLRRLVADALAFLHDADQAERLVAEQDPRGDRQLTGNVFAGDDGSSHGRNARKDFTRARREADTDCAGRTPRSVAGSGRRCPWARRP